jgi:hypothetical protein
MNIDPTPADVQEGWLMRARTQGLVCQICHEPPKYEDRENFFDTGVCEDCSTDFQQASPLTA